MDVQLSQEEANRLISMLKESLIEELNAPHHRETIEFDVQGDSKKDLFTVSIFRGGINAGKINYNARIKVNGIILLQLHLNATNRHFNPDGELITGSHWHIYKEGYGHSFAFPAGELTNASFTESAVAFLEKFNVIRLPTITEQTEIKG